ncbi:MAG: hypothetical protein ACRC2T_09890 [Thermoguttaceae bacterium]
MMRKTLICVLAVMVCACSSCSFFIPTLANNGNTKQSSPLAPAQQPKDAVIVDYVYIRVSYEQRDLLTALWQDGSTNEQVIPVELRKRLAKEGLRIGVQGVSMSQSLSRLLEIDKVRLEESTGNLLVRTTETPTSITNNITEVGVEDLTVEQMIKRWQIALQPGKSVKFKTYDDPLPEAAVFWNDSGFCGKAFPKALGVVEISAISYPDGSGVRFDILPILEYGDTKRNFVINTGNLMPENRQENLKFDNLKSSVKLLPGQWLFIGPSCVDPPGIGRHFFSRERGQRELKIIAIRLAGSSQY